jgi:hypothetical protein
MRRTGLTAAMLAAFALISTSTHAAVYKCVVDGKTTFSQRPCEGDMEKITIKEASPRSSTYQENTDYKQLNEQMDDAINKRRADTRLYNLKRDLRNLIDERAENLEYWRSQIKPGITKLDLILIQNKMAEVRSEYDRAIALKKQQIQNTSSRIGPKGR